MTPPTTTSGTITTRQRAFAATRRDRGTVLYDPLTGQTHQAGRELNLGRVHLDPAEVAGWPVVHPGDVQDQAPISVCWSPLVRCNLACPHCLDDKTVHELPSADRRRIAGLLAESDVLGVDISGGEPLLLRELPTLVEILVAGGCTVSITTNGTHLARRASALAHRVDAIRVSLDGADREQHDRWRGRGSFDKATAGIRAAVAHGIPTQIHTVLLRSTARTSPPAMVTLAAELGVDSVTFLQMLPIGEGTALATTEVLSDDDARRILAEVSIDSAVPVRLRTREAAGGFTVIRADGQLWHNQPGAHAISPARRLKTTADLRVVGRDGSA